MCDIPPIKQSKSYLIIKCPICGLLQLGYWFQKATTCKGCGEHIDVRDLRIVAASTEECRTYISKLKGIKERCGKCHLGQTDYEAEGRVTCTREGWSYEKCLGSLFSPFQYKSRMET